MAVLNEDETQSYLLGPYNISDIEFCSDQTIKKVEIDSWGKINFFMHHTMLPTHILGYY